MNFIPEYNKNSLHGDVLISVLLITDKPLWNNDDKTMAYSFLSGKVNLTCEVQAEPEANFTWTKDKEVMQPSNIIQIFNNNNTSILQVRPRAGGMKDFVYLGDERLHNYVDMRNKNI